MNKWVRLLTLIFIFQSGTLFAEEVPSVLEPITVEAQREITGI